MSCGGAGWRKLDNKGERPKVTSKLQSKMYTKMYHAFQIWNTVRPHCHAWKPEHVPCFNFNLQCGSSGLDMPAPRTYIPKIRGYCQEGYCGPGTGADAGSRQPFIRPTPVLQEIPATPEVTLLRPSIQDTLQDSLQDLRQVRVAGVAPGRIPARAGRALEGPRGP